MKFISFTCVIVLVFFGMVRAQNANNTPVQGGGSMSGYNSGSAPTGQGQASSQEARTKLSNSKMVTAADNASPTGGKTAAGALLPAPERTKQYTDALKQVLRLNDDQYNRLKPVNADFIKQIDKLTQTSKDNVSFQQGIMEADKIRVEKYRTILNAKQFKIYTDNPQLSGLTGNNEPVKIDMGKPETSAKGSGSTSAAGTTGSAGTTGPGKTTGTAGTGSQTDDTKAVPVTVAPKGSAGTKN